MQTKHVKVNKLPTVLFWMLLKLVPVSSYT